MKTLEIKKYSDKILRIKCISIEEITAQEKELFEKTL